MDDKPREYKKGTFDAFAKVLKKKAAEAGIDVSRVDISPEQREKLNEIIRDLLKVETNG